MIMNAQYITDQLRGQWHGHYGTAPCPVCQPEGRRDQCGLSIKDGDGLLLAHCFKSGCDFRDIAAAINLPPGRVSFDIEAAREAKEKQAAYRVAQRAKARAMWGQGNFIQGTHAERYLRSRSITCDIPDSLRFLPDTYHQPSGQFVCAMIADVQPTGGIHRTFFTKRGVRLGKSAKMMLGPCSGGAVRLSQGQGPLVVCEGVETGLSLCEVLSERSPRVWAALSTSGMKALHLPPEPHAVIIAPDMDPNNAGQDAANVLATRASALGWTVTMLPPPVGNEWNDALQSGVAA